MGSTTRSTQQNPASDLSAVIAEIVTAAVAEALATVALTEGTATPAAKAPAKKARKARAKKAPAKKVNTFYADVIVGGREAREERKGMNAQYAAWCREHDLTPNGEVWSLVKAGCADLRKLKAAQKRDDKARDERKAAANA